jgi:hypothetical protein
MTINPVISAENERKLSAKEYESSANYIINTVSVDNIRGEESVNNKSEKQKQRRN